MQKVILETLHILNINIRPMTLQRMCTLEVFENVFRKAFN